MQLLSNALTTELNAQFDSQLFLFWPVKLFDAV
jgi:hypothetical protein